MRYLVLLLLLFGLEGKAQSYTFTLNECRVEATTGELRESFLVDRIRYFDRGDQTFIFDHESVLSVFDANITNYGRDSLKALIDIWIDSCNVVPIPTPPAPTALFANTTSLELDGVNQFMQIDGSNTAIHPTNYAVTDTLSISGWIYMNTSMTGVYQRLVSKKLNSGSFDGWALSKTDTEGIRFIFNGSTGSTYTTWGNVPKNEWVHIAVTHRGTNANDMECYINGVQQTPGTIVSTAVGTTSNTAYFCLGAYNTAGSYLDGKMDAVTLFNKELTVSEIKELMALRDYSYFSDTASIVSSWYMDSPDDLGVAGGVTDRFGSNDGTGVNTDSTNLTPCITFPYDYSLYSSSLYTNLTPMQNDSADAFGGFGFGFIDIDDRIVISDDNLLSFGNGTTDQPFSISGWISPTDLTQNTIFSKNLGTVNNEYVFRTNSAQLLDLLLYNNAGDANTYQILRSTQALPLNQFSHVVATYDGRGGVDATDGMALYINGDSVTSTTVLEAGTYVAMNNGTANANINLYYGGTGTLNNGNANYGDIIVYDKQLSTAEVSQLYNEHSIIDATKLSNSANIVAYYRGYNSTNVASGVLDQSGNGLNGTMTNTEDDDLQYDAPRSIFEADSAASFSYDGSTEYLTAPDTDSLTMTTLAGTADTSFSVSFWAYQTTAGGRTFFYE